MNNEFEKENIIDNEEVESAEAEEAMRENDEVTDKEGKKKSLKRVNISSRL